MLVRILINGQLCVLGVFIDHYVCTPHAPPPFEKCCSVHFEMSGFDCEFVEEPPKVLQTHCPICLLVLREPFQVTCCGKSFCRRCIQRINAGGTPCPTCNEARFDSFQNKGLQQPLYGFRVFCSNKESGCDWQGELGQLDQHLDVNPDKDKQFQGCVFTDVNCLYCNNPLPKYKIEHHQTSQCAERPFTCSLCEEYESTYADVITNHSPVCKCRPVECPNSCGTNNLQHQHLEEHVSTQCPLTYVECEFSDAGCGAKVYRKDLPSHLGENMVTHMSLLARENRKLKQQLREQEEYQDRKLKQQLEVQSQQISRLFLSQVPPLVFTPSFSYLERSSSAWCSQPFYSHIGGYKLCVKLSLSYISWSGHKLQVQYVCQPDEFRELPPPKLRVRSILVSQDDGSHNLSLDQNINNYGKCALSHFTGTPMSMNSMKSYFVSNDQLVFRVSKVDVW